MALPPTRAAAAPPAPVPEQPMPMPEEGMETESPWMPVATILKNEETGEFMLVDGDEPEPEEGIEPEGPTFKDGPGVLRALMGKLEGGDAAGAEESFGKAFRGEEDTAPEPSAPMPG